MLLTVFPGLLSSSYFAPTMLRITAALVFFYLAVHHFKHKKEAAEEISMLSHETAVWAIGILILIECGVGGLLFVGAWTQLAALLGAILCLKITLVRKGLRSLAPFSHLSYILLAVICLSLLLTGSGALGFDVPL